MMKGRVHPYVNTAIMAFIGLMTTLLVGSVWNGISDLKEMKILLHVTQMDVVDIQKDLDKLRNR